MPIILNTSYLFELDTKTSTLTLQNHGNPLVTFTYSDGQVDGQPLPTPFQTTFEDFQRMLVEMSTWVALVGQRLSPIPPTAVGEWQCNVSYDRGPDKGKKKGAGPRRVIVDFSLGNKPHPPTGLIKCEYNHETGLFTVDAPLPVAMSWQEFTAVYLYSLGRLLGDAARLREGTFGP